VSGHPRPQQGTISSYLVENAAFNVYSTSDPARGKLAQTDYRVVKEHKGLSLVQIQLLTGRKHQIRVHFAEKGHSLIGDRKYGKSNVASANLALHAWSLSFIHPVSRERMTYTTTVPPLFSRLVGNFELPGN
jgi:tRNA pseudouridine32 synthase/23S rRNA pseudouridine746 synthase/23S rRNA pseudouridine1911/1915/1917 synthase